MRRDDGFTLIEMLVAVTLTVIIFGAVLDVTNVVQRQARANQLRGAAQDHARNAVDQMATALRDAVAPAGSSAAIERNGPYDVIFQSSDPLTPSNRVHIRYCIDSTAASERLLQQKAPASAALPGTACPDTTSTGWTSATPQALASDVVNRASATSPTPAWTYQTSGSTIVGVGIDLMVDADPLSPPGPTRLTSSVTLRNVNRPPVAAVSCQLENNRHVVCDASGSSDPEGAQLSYAWSYASPPTASSITSYRFDQAMAPGTYTFTVTVTDPAGATSSATSSPVTVT